MRIGLMTEFPLSQFLDINNFSPQYRSFLAVISAEIEPTIFHEAVNDERWRGVIGNEVGALEESNTWDITMLHVGKKAIGSKWIYRIKYHADKTIEKYKARLVALGDKKEEGVYHKETFFHQSLRCLR